MSLRSGKLSLLGSEDEVFYHTGSFGAAVSFSDLVFFEGTYTTFTPLFPPAARTAPQGQQSLPQTGVVQASSFAVTLQLVFTFAIATKLNVMSQLDYDH